MLGFAKKRLEGTGPAIAFAALTSIIAAVMSAVAPVFSRVFLDRLLTGRNPRWLMPYLVLLGGFNLIQIIMSALQNRGFHCPRLLLRAHALRDNHRQGFSARFREDQNEGEYLLRNPNTGRLFAPQGIDDNEDQNKGEGQQKIVEHQTSVECPFSGFPPYGSYKA